MWDGYEAIWSYLALKYYSGNSSYSSSVSPSIFEGSKNWSNYSPLLIIGSAGDWMSFVNVNTLVCSDYSSITLILSTSLTGLHPNVWLLSTSIPEAYSPQSKIKIDWLADAGLK